MNLIQAMQSVDIEELIDRLNLYAVSRLKTIGIKDFNGKEPIDFVSDLILKVMEGKRDWNKSQCSFDVFLFGCLKSEIYNFFITNKHIHTDEMPEISSNEISSNLEIEKDFVVNLLSTKGADDDELLVFECWMDGIVKPREIANYLGIEIKLVYNIIKRLERRLPQIQAKAKEII